MCPFFHWLEKIFPVNTQEWGTERVYEEEDSVRERCGSIHPLADWNFILAGWNPKTHFPEHCPIPLETHQTSLKPLNIAHPHPRDLGDPSSVKLNSKQGDRHSLWEKWFASVKVCVYFCHTSTTSAQFADRGVAEGCRCTSWSVTFRSCHVIYFCPKHRPS